MLAASAGVAAFHSVLKLGFFVVRNFLQRRFPSFVLVRLVGTGESKMTSGVRPLLLTVYIKPFRSTHGPNRKHQIHRDE